MPPWTRAGLLRGASAAAAVFGHRLAQAQPGGDGGNQVAASAPATASDLHMDAFFGPGLPSHPSSSGPSDSDSNLDMNGFFATGLPSWPDFPANSPVEPHASQQMQQMPLQNMVNHMMVVQYQQQYMQQQHMQQHQHMQQQRQQQQQQLRDQEEDFQRRVQTLTDSLMTAARKLDDQLAVPAQPAPSQQRAAAAPNTTRMLKSVQTMESCRELLGVRS